MYDAFPHSPFTLMQDATRFIPSHIIFKFQPEAPFKIFQPHYKPFGIFMTPCFLFNRSIGLKFSFQTCLIHLNAFQQIVGTENSVVNYLQD